MAGPFDDLIPAGASSAQRLEGAHAGPFDDLIPKAGEPGAPGAKFGGVGALYPGADKVPAGDVKPKGKGSMLERLLLWETRKMEKARDLGHLFSGQDYGIPFPTEEEAGDQVAKQGQGTFAGMARTAGRAAFGIGPNVAAGVRSVAGGEDFDSALNDERRLQEQFAQARPDEAQAAALTGLAGTMALPVGRVLEGATGAINLGMRSAGVGTGMAATTGFAEGGGDNGSRVVSAGQHAIDFATDPKALALAIGLPVAANVGGQAFNALMPGNATRGRFLNALHHKAGEDAARLGETVATADAFDNAGVRNIAVAHMGHPEQLAARVVSNIPIIGKPLEGALVDAYGGARAAGERLAGGLTTADTMDEAGLALTNGLARYRGTTLQEMEPAELRALGIQPTQPAAPNARMSQDAAQRAAQAQPIGQQAGIDITALRGQATRPTTIQEVGNPADPNDPLLTRLARGTDPAAPHEPPIPFATQAEAMYERARRGVPEIYDAQGNAANQVATPNSGRTIGTILQQEVDARVNGGITQGRFAPMLADLANPQARWTLPQLMAARTEVGRALSNFGEFETGMDVSQLKRIYGALSDDIDAGMKDIAHRAILGTRGQGYFGRNGQPVTAEAAGRAVNSVADFRTASSFYSREMERMDQFAKLIDAKTPEMAMQRLTAAALSGTKGDIGLIRAAHGSLSAEQWNQVAGVMLRQMWRPNPSATGYVAETGFSAEGFTKNWERMTPEARNLLFGHANCQALEDFVRVSRSMKEFEDTVNRAKSGEHLITALVGGEFLNSLLHNPFLVFGTPALGRAATAAFASPQFTRAYVALQRAKLEIARTVSTGRMAPSSPALQSAIDKLSVIASRRPDIAPVAAALIDHTQQVMAQAPSSRRH